MMFILLSVGMMIAMMVSAVVMMMEENRKREAKVKTSRFGVYPMNGHSDRQRF
ncbi:hypothetical protein [Phyllobacterium myrsinacearum]|uniref:Uncharacterized protein n=1 Tax=Phyllobacterium myrsinacearum TaxID=28101 RepID=A0A839EY57_9HYPH|nr:hypothetical protein [Phyllobacterium myrsinacearum]MBA8881327.1 hypothetical protein [Phyllobacterium myrsinacearum]